METNKFIASLSESPSQSELKQLIGQDISVIKMQSEWKKMVVIVDAFKVERISCTIDVGTGALTAIQLWGEMSLKGQKKFDSWLDIKSLKLLCASYDRTQS